MQYCILKRYNTEYRAWARFCKVFKALQVTLILMRIVGFWYLSEKEKNVWKVKSGQSRQIYIPRLQQQSLQHNCIKNVFIPYNIYALCYFHFRNHYLALQAACCELFPMRTVHLAWRFSPGSFKVSQRFMNLFECLGWFMGLTWTQVRLIGLCLRFWARSCSNLQAKLTEHEPS